MSIVSHVDPERRRVVATVRGDFTFEEIVATLDRTARDPRFRRGFDILSDHTAVGEPITPDQARRLVARLGQLADVFGGSRWAVVTTKPASYGMLRMISVMAEQVPMEIRVFLSLDEAESWLSGAAGPPQAPPEDESA